MSLNQKYDIKRLRRVCLLILFILLLLAFIPWHKSVTVKGHVQPRTILPIFACEEGRVTDVFVTSGQMLFKGQPLLQMEKTIEKQVYQSIQQEKILWNDYAQSQYTSIKKELEVLSYDTLARKKLLSLASLKHSFLEQLLQQGAIQKKEFLEQSLELNEKLKGYYEAIANESYKAYEKEYFAQKGIKIDALGSIQDVTAEINLLSQQAEYQARNLETYRLFSPIDGILICENPQNLQQNYFKKGSILMEIADTQLLEVRALANDSKIAVISPGQDADIKVWISPSTEFQIFPGKVTHVSSSLGLEENKKMFIVHIHVDTQETEKLMKVGASAKVKIKTERGNTYQHFFNFIRKLITSKK